MALAAAAAADCAYDTMQLTARSMGHGVMARGHIWLRQWQGDSASSSRIINLPFRGGKLFGEDLEPMLIENEDKHKGLPSTKKPTQKKVQPFQGFSLGFKPRNGFQGNKPRWDKNRSSFKFKKSGGPSPTTTQAGKSPKGQQSS